MSRLCQTLRLRHGLSWLVTLEAPNLTVLRRHARRACWIASCAAVARLSLDATLCGGGEGATEVEEPPAPPPVEEPEGEPDAEPEPVPEPETVDRGDAELVWTAAFNEDGGDSVNVTAPHPDGERLLVGVDSTYLVQAADG